MSQFRRTPPPRPFELFLPKSSPHERCVAEALATQVAPELTAGDWRLVEAEARWRVEEACLPDPLLHPPPRKRRTPPRGAPQSTSTGSGRVRVAEWDDDPLKRIPAEVYLAALAGLDVSATGRCRCPAPDHEDVHPSAKAYGASWYCFSCGAGGSIIDLAAALYGLQPRGTGYREIRARIAGELGLRGRV